MSTQQPPAPAKKKTGNGGITLQRDLESQGSTQSPPSTTRIPWALSPSNNRPGNKELILSNGHYASAIGRGEKCRSQMTHLLTWLSSSIFLVKASQQSLPPFIGNHLM